MEEGVIARAAHDLLCTPSSVKEEGEFLLGEALLIRKGGGSGKGSISGYTIKTEIFTENGSFIVPNALNQSFSVRIFGGGGGCGGYFRCASQSDMNNGIFQEGDYYTGGGGGGWMNNSTLTLNEGENIPITIGAGGSAFNFRQKVGNSSSYYWANGNGNTGGTTSFGTYLSANGGGYSDKNGNGGNGGSGGGAAVAFSGTYCNGGHGYQFGGGGGQNYAGNGGTWGGGGGVGSINSRMGYGGTYGSNGGTNNAKAVNGINTIGIGLDFEGDALGGGYGGGGGGYGGRGGRGSTPILKNQEAGGGGGGYGANGGNGASAYSFNSSYYYVSAGGGGGGYGDDGGDGWVGGMAIVSNGVHHAAGGYGGGYGRGGYGRGGYKLGDGKPGVCIIQYQAPIYT